jgi:alkylation response protein AidB-like acyl-CoA dehydrogenase
MTLLAAARDLAPAIAARAAEIEVARRLPADLAADMAAAGLFRMAVPRSLGGAEAPPAAIFAVLETLAAADAATGWCAMIAGTTALSSAWLPAPHAAEVFGNPLGISGGASRRWGRRLPTAMIMSSAAAGPGRQDRPIANG